MEVDLTAIQLLYMPTYLSSSIIASIKRLIAWGYMNHMEDEQVQPFNLKSTNFEATEGPAIHQLCIMLQSELVEAATKRGNHIKEHVAQLETNQRNIGLRYASISLQVKKFKAEVILADLTPLIRNRERRH